MAEQKIAVRRDSGHVAFYLNGCLQLDSRDEKIYHEYLVRPALGVVRLRCSGAFHALILGGGDGFAAREILTASTLERVDLVDFDASVLGLGRGEFATWNGGALSDRRLALHCVDAVEFLESCRHQYDLIVVDFTFPEDLASCGLFTERFYSSVKRSLAPDGVVALNAVSPTISATAYWSIYRTLKNVGLGPRPYKASIPSFLNHGYGEWGFFLGSPRPILSRELRSLRFSGEGLPSRSAFLHSLCFPVTHVLFGQGCARSIVEPADLLWMLSLRLPVLPDEGESINFIRRNPLKQLERSDVPVQGAMLFATSDIATHVLWALRSLDWNELFKEMERQMKGIPAGLREEINRLRDEEPEALREHLLSREGIQRALMALIVVMIVINIVYPDNAYAKGYYGSHYGSHHSSHYNSSVGEGASMLLTAPVPAAPFRNLQFLQGGVVLAPDMQGKIHPSRRVSFVGPSGAAVEEPVTYMLADDLFLSLSGHVYYTIPASPFFYAINSESLDLFREGDVAPLMSFALDVQLVKTLKENLAAQKTALDKTLQDYGRWLGWAESAALWSDGMKEEVKEVRRLRDLQKVFNLLDQVFGNYVPPLDDAGSSVRLAPGVYLSAQDAIVLRAGFGKWSSLSFRGFYVDDKLPRAVASPEMVKFIEAVVRWNIMKLPADDPLRQRLFKGLGGAPG